MEERIKYLFRQYLENKCSRKEFEEFFLYMREAAHDDTIRAMIKNAYDDTGHTSLTYVDECGNLVLPEPEWFVRPASESLPRRKRYLAALALTGAVIMAAFATWLMVKPFSRENAISLGQSLTKKTTERSEYKYLLLPDSTQVWLNAASTLEFPARFTAGKREVFLSGEAYFDVKHAESLPFIIHTGKVSTTVLGTAFNIKAYPGLENIIVAVSRGKVRVQYGNREVATLTKGQQVKVSNANNGVTEKKMTTNDVAAWQQGNLVFDDETIQDIVSELERTYNVSIRIQDAAVANLRLRTTFKREIGVQENLEILCSSTDTELKQVNGSYLIQ